MEIKLGKLSPLVILTILGIVIGGIVVANPGWFSFIQDFGGLDESDRRMTDTFVLTELPEYFIADVVLEGSGYTGQLHTVNISINQNRPDSSVWIASGNYFLNLELTVGVSEETITSGSFANLRNTAPYVAPTYSWTPESPAGTYSIVLSLNNIVWSMLPQYTILAIAGSGGSISPSGAVIVDEGNNQEFTIEANEGYEISSILVDGEAQTIDDPYISSYIFISVNADHTITASFELMEITHTITATAIVGGTIEPEGAVIVADGGDQTFTITADTGYDIVDIFIDGQSWAEIFPSDPVDTNVESYTFVDVTADHTIHALFNNTP